MAIGGGGGGRGCDDVTTNPWSSTGPWAKGQFLSLLQYPFMKY